MFPCFIQMAPRIHWPASGDLYQNIAPETDWFTTHIGPEAGDAKVEKEINKEVASYGKQLGKLTELCLILAGEIEVEPGKKKELLGEIKEINTKVAAVVDRRRHELREQARSVLSRLKKSDADGFEQVMKDFGPKTG